MSDESTTPDLVELVQRAIEAANRRDLDAVITSFAPDAVFEGRALGDIFEGRPAIRNFLEDWFGAYEELVIGLEEVSDLRNGVVFAVVTQDGRPVGSAGHLRQREGWVFLWVRGLIPVFAQIKTNRRMERFKRRGLAAVRSEWRFITATHNLLKLHRRTLRVATT
jgi:ketosteroid isomerase-like protein